MDPSAIAAILLPPEVDPLFVLVAVVAAGLTSALTGTFGLGGGVALLAVLSQGLPPAFLIPIHGVAQLGSNLGRAIVQRRFLERRVALLLGAGSLAGALAGAALVVSLPEGPMLLALGLFVLWATFGPKPRPTGGTGAPALVAGGAVSAFLSMFFGATGPVLMAVLLTLGLARQALVATHAAVMSLQHGLKVAAFGGLGLDFTPWLGFLALVVGAGFLGTLFGSRLLARLPATWFDRGLKVIMAALGGKLLVDGLLAMFPTGG